MSGRILAAMALFAFLPALAAQEPKLPDVKAFDKLVVDTLRDVHNEGALLYNLKKDFEGTYRMYQGAVLTVRPLLGHRPAAQKMIDDGLAAAEKESNVAQKAFKLHEAIESVRAHLKGEKKPEDKKPVDKKNDKKPEVKKPVEKKPEIKKPAAAGGGPGFRGTVTFKGKPVPEGEIAFVTLDKPRPVVFTASIQGDGQYAPAVVVPPGQYVVIVTGKVIPPKYHLTTTSGLTVQVGPPPSVCDFDLN